LAPSARVAITSLHLWYAESARAHGNWSKKPKRIPPPQVVVVPQAPVLYARAALGFLQRQLDERVGAGLAVEIAAGRDDRFELRCRDRNARDDAADAARLFVEVPDELAPGGLLRVAPAVPGFNL